MASDKFWMKQWHWKDASFTLMSDRTDLYCDLCLFACFSHAEFVVKCILFGHGFEFTYYHGIEKEIQKERHDVDV